MDNKTKARILRRNQTEAEAALWRKLRGRGLDGYKFRRQVPVGPYVADFLCKEAMLIIEIDGGQHAEQVEYDRFREDFLKTHCYHVVRFWNNEVLNNLDGVLETLTLTLSQREREVKDGLSQRARGLGNKKMGVAGNGNGNR
jgi:very-short-patch-repair endonuclease